jgi:hypothetical protein
MLLTAMASLIFMVPVVAISVLMPQFPAQGVIG